VSAGNDEVADDDDEGWVDERKDITEDELKELAARRTQSIVISLFLPAANSELLAISIFRRDDRLAIYKEISTKYFPYL
jgi:hypothetical protein